MIKEHDWIVANINNPDFSNGDFRDVLGMTPDNTQILSMDEYMKSAFITDTFKNEYGNFDKEIFKNWY